MLSSHTASYVFSEPFLIYSFLHLLFLSHDIFVEVNLSHDIPQIEFSWLYNHGV